MSSIRWDPGSFRDPAGSVFFYDKDVYRTLNNQDIKDIDTLVSLEFFCRYVQSGTIIPTSLEKNPFPDK